MIPYESRGLTQAQMQQIVELYIEQGLLSKQIAKQFNVSYATVFRVLQAANVDTSRNRGQHNRKLSDHDIDEIVRLYTTPASDGTWRGSVRIAERFGTTDTCIRMWLHKRGISIRSQTEAHAHGKRCKPVKNLPPEGQRPPVCKCGCGQPVQWSRQGNCWYKYIKGHYRRKREFHDPEWLHREYIEKQRPSTDIAAQCGVHGSTILLWLRKAGIDIRSQAESLRLSGAVAGERNPAWNGGIADWDYSPNWKAICRLVRKRDEYTCQLCGKQFKPQSRTLHIHHIDEDKRNTHPWNLIALCSSCHHPLHGNSSIRPHLSAIARERTKNIRKYLW